MIAEVWLQGLQDISLVRWIPSHSLSLSAASRRRGLQGGPGEQDKLTHQETSGGRNGEGGHQAEKWKEDAEKYIDELDGWMDLRWKGPGRDLVLLQ